MTGRKVLIATLVCLGLVVVAGGVVVIPPYICGWLPEYPSPVDRVEYYWSPMAQFLRCNSILHDLDAAKDAYALEHDIVSPDSPLIAEQIGLSQAQLKEPDFRCPSGGWYLINPPGVHPVCSIHGDSLIWEEGQPFPTRDRPAPRLKVVVPVSIQLGPEDRIEVPPPDDGSGID